MARRPAEIIDAHAVECAITYRNNGWRRSDVYNIRAFVTDAETLSLKLGRAPSRAEIIDLEMSIRIALG